MPTATISSRGVHVREEKEGGNEGGVEGREEEEGMAKVLDSSVPVTDVEIRHISEREGRGRDRSPSHPLL